MTTNSIPKRDYSIVGPESQRAIDRGLAAAEWYHTEVPRATMKELMQRSDGPPLRDNLLWLGLILATGIGGIVFWGTWWCVPFFIVYGVLYGSASDSRWHECGHGTAFKTPWMNRVIYQIACFMLIRNPVTWKWSHARHHSDTIIVGRDVEIAVMRPPVLFRVMMAFIGILDAWDSLGTMVRNASGNLSDAEKSFIPKGDWPKAIFVPRVWIAIYTATAVTAFAMQSILPFMLIGLPRLYGCWHMVLVGLLQHGGLAEDVTDHRLNTRTVLMNPVSRFLYLDMNYHVEHHMFPVVPYYALERLHETIKHDLPPPTPSILAGYREMIPIWLRQLRGENVFLKKQLPPTARPYREDLDFAVPMTGADPAE
jgi:fatty acid desaturase